MVRSGTARRTLVALGLVAIVGFPALVLRLACVGQACAQPATLDAVAPFCDLPAFLREGLRLGFRDGRSPDVLAVTERTAVMGGTALGDTPVAWPSVSSSPADSAVPLVFYGAGIARGAAIPDGTGLEDVAPTISRIIALRRPHPGVRSGEAIASVTRQARHPRLVLEIVLKGIGTLDLEESRGDWPYIRSLARRGTSTMDARMPSLPLDPAAVATTLGTGGVPREHGITGSFVRNDRGQAVRAWGPDTPFSVIATLGDHLDELLGQRPRIGVVGTAASDRGLIGGNWHVDNDRDDVILGSGRSGPQTSAALALLEDGYGRDGTPDLLAVVLDDTIESMDSSVRLLVEAAFEATDGPAAVVVTSTGSTRGPPGPQVSWREVEARLEREVGRPVVAATVLGGMFLDQKVLAESGITEDPIVQALKQIRAPQGEPIMADVFSGIAVTFAEFC